MSQTQDAVGLRRDGSWPIPPSTEGPGPGHSTALPELPTGPVNFPAERKTRNDFPF